MRLPGTFAVVSLMTGSVVEQLVPAQPQINGSSLEAADLEDQRIAVASAVALLSGLIMLGVLSTYLSESVVKAFTSAAAFHVAVSQLQSMLGLRLPRHSGNFALFKTLASVLENLPQTNMAELLISLVCLAVLVPIKEINHHYRTRLRTPIPVEILTWLLGDSVAGLTVGVLHIPQGMAFALLTSVAPVFGLYTSFFPVLLYLLLGTGRHVSTGTFAVVSLMTGSVVEQLVPAQPQINGSSLEAADLEDQRIAVASAVALLSGLIMVCMFVLQLGVLSTYLSESVVKAFTSAAAFHVAVSQLQSMLGLRLPRHSGNFALFKHLCWRTFPRPTWLNSSSPWCVSRVLVPIKEINHHYRTRLRTPIPVEILTVRHAVTPPLHHSYTTAVYGSVTDVFPSPRMPALHVFPDIVADTVAITFVGYAVSVSLATIYADKHAYSIHPNQ
ncbi:hypothetical protein CRUP_038605, partial [Coryphaenoides rupestris]